jgi:hypothetical protein
MNGHTVVSRAAPVIVLAAAIEAVTEAPAAAQRDPTTLISVNLAGAAGNGPSSQPSLSADARYIAFTSDASGLCCSSP